LNPLPEGPDSAETAILKLTLACDLSQVPSMAGRLREFLLAQGCAEDSMLQCLLAVVEACTNAMRHAPATARDEPVVVEARRIGDQFEFRITDHNPSFPWPEAAVLPNPESESGRGLFLIRSLMDSVEYAPAPAGNSLTLRKSRFGA
jgi:serine/threonine-protein kinase RsbW